MDDIKRMQELQEYAFFLAREEYSQATISKYLRDIRKFCQFGGDEKHWNKDMVMAYKAHISKTYKTNSVNSMLASVNFYLAWKGLSNIRVKSIRVQKQMFCDQEKELTRDEYERLINAARAQGNIRLEMMMQTIGGTGIRISELPFITVEAVLQGKAVVHAKGKQRIIFLTTKLRKHLIHYCRQKRMISGPVFITRNGRVVDRSNMWREMKQLCEVAGVSKNKVFPHNLRHLFARACYQKNKDIVYLADILGHSNIETTRIYTINSGQEHKKMLNSLGLVI